jgi:DNA polymerase zeta
MLRILFEKKDLSLVKSYFENQCQKILTGGNKISIKDFIFSKEVRLGHYSEVSSALPPGAIVALKSMELDPQTAPPYRWRCPYVVVYGSPESKLKDLVVSPYELKRGSNMMRINANYYISKAIIPALDRLFSLIG